MNAKQFLAGTAVVLIMGAPLAAGAANTATTTDTSKVTATSSPAAKSGSSTSTGAETQMKASEMRASKFIGMNVYGPDDKSIGEVSDLILDRDSGKIGSAILSVGGFLGIGEKKVAVPMDELKPTGDKKDRLTLNMTKEQLQSAPSYVFNDSTVGGSGSSAPPRSTTGSSVPALGAPSTGAPSSGTPSGSTAPTPPAKPAANGTVTQ